MAGVTDLPFRLIVRQFGCHLAFSEMVSATGLIKGNRRTFDYLPSAEKDHPLGVQIFGADPDTMAKAARMAEESGADLIDINMGCPVRKVIKTGAGAALLKNLSLAKEIIERVKKAISIPLTVKIRAGWRKNEICAVELAKMAESEGINAITVHPRTAEQGYGGKADWNIIAQVKAAVKIPVIGNGDIHCALDVLRMMEETHCDAVMIGRAALGNPWIFRDASALLKGQHLPSPPNWRERREIINLHLHLIVEKWGELRGIHLFRKHLLWYTKGIPGGSKLRNALATVKHLEEIKHILSHALYQIIT